MNRRAAIVGSGVALAGAVASSVAAQPATSGAYDVTLKVQPSKKPDEYLCRISFRSGESGRIHESEVSFKSGSKYTHRLGEGRRDGSSIDLTVDVTVDDSGKWAEFATKVTDGTKTISVQRTTIELNRA